ncbi:bifunctional (p)ppGpp synthetase/guanosine-3',5'-bis(diphosphate) 3'-pyrophosphohydrolase [Candidatus Uhrbacteria bacterium]|nr:bifunctional (p)ppGpp synthetase/guanosine-3',5'-bis(diphosphate) 3'-pyrophosphohydrolase [Candidatus Uhrbacteria bacterium]
MAIRLPPPSDFHTLSVQEERFFTLIQHFHTSAQALLTKAYQGAKEAHAPQMRDDGTPYILHPLRATLCLIDECGITNVDTLCGALLHDVIEDTPVTNDSIARDFGGEVARLVRNVTRPRPLCEDDELISKDKAQKFLAIMDKDERTRLIKCADVLDNVRSWPNIPCDSMAQKKLPRWYEEIEHYALPLAQKTHPVLFAELDSAFSFAKKNKDLCVPIALNASSL